jgi:hypothetical protein
MVGAATTTRYSARKKRLANEASREKVSGLPLRMETLRGSTGYAGNAREIPVSALLAVQGAIRNQ